MPESNRKQTLVSLFDSSCAEYADRPAVGFAFTQPLTYGQLREKSILIAAMLCEYGIKKEDRVAILAENSPEWGIVYLAIIRVGGIAVPILPDFTESDVIHILTDSEAEILFITQKQLEKTYELSKQKVKAIITLDDSTDKNRLVKTETFSHFLDKGARLPAKKLHAPARKIHEEDVASIIYTSGTSGHSKAVMLTHKNFFSNVKSTESVLVGRGISEWTFLSTLPMSHTYEFTIGFLLPLANGARITYIDKTPTPTILEKICQVEQPTVMCMVPMVMEKIYKKKILPAITSNKVLKAAIKLPIIRKKIFSIIAKKLLEFFGGKLQLLAFGGAALNTDVEKFLAETGIPYIVGYGLTEASPLVSAGPYGDSTIALGSAGKPVSGVKVKIVNPDPLTEIGEIHVHGPNIMKGYYKNSVATREAIDPEGWLATGDLGNLDQQNNLFIKGRSKSVIVLSHGENIYPEAIEEKINSCFHVIESLVTENDDRLEARVYLDYELIDQETKGKTQQQKFMHIEQLLKKIQTEVNRQIPPYSQIAKLIERQAPFIKTPTHKIKRYLYNNAKKTIPPLF